MCKIIINSWYFIFKLFISNLGFVILTFNQESFLMYEWFWLYQLFLLIIIHPFYASLNFQLPKKKLFEVLSNYLSLGLSPCRIAGKVEEGREGRPVLKWQAIAKLFTCQDTHTHAYHMRPFELVLAVRLPYQGQRHTRYTRLHPWGPVGLPFRDDKYYGSVVVCTCY